MSRARGYEYSDQLAGHDWNIVRIDGVYYHLDVTWNASVPDKAGYVRHKCFNISDKTIMKAHR